MAVAEERWDTVRSVLELINLSAWGMGGVGALAMVWAGARELRRGHAHPDPSVGAVGASGGLDAGGGGRVRRGAGQAVRDSLRGLADGYMAAERWCGARVPAWVGLPWLRVRRSVGRGRRYAHGRARRIRGSLATSHRHGSTSVRRVREELIAEARAVLADRAAMPRWSVVWAEGVLS